MSPVQAIILGIIEGLTEYLPISSTGHLIVAQHLMGLGTGADPLDKAAADAFAISIQGGAILAVLSLYFPRVLQMFRGLLGKDREGLRLTVAMLCGFLPAAVIGLLLNDWIEAKLFGLKPVVVAWIVGGIAILVVARRRRNIVHKGAGIDLAEITWKMALVIGFAQCIAMWPGTSRSLMTIVGGVLVGLSLRSAVEYSFLLGVLTLGAATMKKAIFPVSGIPGYDGLLGGAQLMVNHYGTLNLVLGVVAGMVSAIIAVKWMVTYLQRHGMEIFGYYRIGIGIIISILLLTGAISH
jgi:undecaprenyl-diphosphatase